MRREQPTIYEMRVLPQSISVCALMLLQLASASGHVLHHAGEGAVPQRCGCAEAYDNPPSTCHHGPNTDAPVQHDCDGCSLCDASDEQIAQVRPQQRSIEDLATACSSAQLVVAQPQARTAFVLHSAAPPGNPALFHALTLPLLD
jgi:hypothetical protein